MWSFFPSVAAVVMQAVATAVEPLAAPNHRVQAAAQVQQA
jgi:hypothetical protein